MLGVAVLVPPRRPEALAIAPPVVLAPAWCYDSAPNCWEVDRQDGSWHMPYTRNYSGQRYKGKVATVWNRKKTSGFCREFCPLGHLGVSEKLPRGGGGQHGVDVLPSPYLAEVRPRPKIVPTVATAGFPNTHPQGNTHGRKRACLVASCRTIPTSNSAADITALRGNWSSRNPR